MLFVVQATFSISNYPGAQAMQQVKLFKHVEAEIGQLEKDINDWIATSGAKIISITGNIAPQSKSSTTGAIGSGFAPSDVLVVIFYETASE